MNERTFFRPMLLLLSWSIADIQYLENQITSQGKPGGDANEHHEVKMINKQYLKTTVGSNQY